jgi:hypothetical protein
MATSSVGRQGQLPRPKISPSQGETPPRPAAEWIKQKPPDSHRKTANTHVTVARQQRVPFPNPPAGSKSIAYVEQSVQEPFLRPEVTRYLRERIMTPDGHPGRMPTGCRASWDISAWPRPATSWSF